jgi:hypothetical protein
MIFGGKVSKNSIERCEIVKSRRLSNVCFITWITMTEILDLHPAPSEAYTKEVYRQVAASLLWGSSDQGSPTVRNSNTRDGNEKCSY